MIARKIEVGSPCSQMRTTITFRERMICNSTMYQRTVARQSSVRNAAHLVLCLQLVESVVTHDLKDLVKQLLQRQWRDLLHKTLGFVLCAYELQ